MKNIDGKTISIKCDTKDTLNIAEMTELQGTLKERTDVDYDKIKLSMIKFGFSFPFFVAKLEGKNYILDGHGRFATLCKMQKDGYIIPDLPVVYVECKDKKEAKEKLLRLNSQYGKMTAESVIEFIGGEFELNTEEISLPSGVISFEGEELPPENLDDTSGNTKELAVKISFKKQDELENFLQRYKDEINEEYKTAYISVSGGAL